MAFLNNIFGDSSSRLIKPLLPVVKKINALEPSFSSLSDDDLRSKTDSFKARLTAGETLDDLLPEAFAAVREASKRTLGQRHFDVQLIGGQVLHNGGVAEMKTGEGKTLVATLPAYLNALTGKGVHVVTVNDYLSRRDAVWMGQIYNALGLSVGILNHEQSFLYDPMHRDLDAERDEVGSFKVVHEFLRQVTRKEAYDADITYGTNNEFGFDYLRDNLEYDKSRLRQRGYHFAVVDEVDSILIDEARTPLIISAPSGDSEGLYDLFAKLARTLNKDEHYTVDEKKKAISTTDSGITVVEKALGVENIYTEKGIKYVHHLETAIKAKELYTKDRDYVNRDGEIVIVDEFTGRLQPGRRWSEGLHQAIEAKEGVKIQKESRTFASITYQNYFRMYEKLSGMTGTALTSKEEFYKVYGFDVAAIPTNKPSLRKDYDDLIFQTEFGKFKAVAKKIKQLHENGQPVLVGTVSIEKNELLSAYLKNEGVPHEVLNAKNHEKEGEIIAQAGKKGAVTVATNMAGRGVDIKLGGNPSTPELYEEVRATGGLFVIGTERHEARRIDNQLRGRTGRQGDPGGTQFFVSLEDSMMRIFASDAIKKLMGKIGLAEDEPIQNSFINRALESAQTKIEGHNFDARKFVLQFDDVLNLQRKTIYSKRRNLLVGGSKEIYEFIDSIIDPSDEETRKIVEAKKAKFGEEQFALSIQRAALQAIDMYWVEHLEAMDYMRGSVQLRAYGQRDPLTEYKKEGLRLFKTLETVIEDEIVKLVVNIGGDVYMPATEKLTEVHESKTLVGSMVGANENGNDAEKPGVAKPNIGPEVGRNEPCPCGSGKKFKHCGLANTSEHQSRMKLSIS
jgi:preprotein translocase subunit SecA